MAPNLLWADLGRLLVGGSVGVGISVALNTGLSGWPLSGPDIGGFRGSGSGPLFARWIGIGALLPFARGHTEKGSANKEPWAFGPKIEAIARMCRLAEAAGAPARGAVVLACLSKAYFLDPLEAAGAHPLLLTTGLMAPEAYTLHAAIEAWVEEGTTEAVVEAAAHFGRFFGGKMTAAGRLALEGLKKQLREQPADACRKALGERLDMANDDVGTARFCQEAGDHLLKSVLVGRGLRRGCLTKVVVLLGGRQRGMAVCRADYTELERVGADPGRVHRRHGVHPC